MASLAGATVGYTSSLMDFWNGDFLFTATTPEISVGIASYEFQLSDTTRLAFAAESGLPSSAQTSEGIRSLDFSSPTATARLRYVKDNVTLHVSGVVREAEFPGVDVALPSPDSEHENGLGAELRRYGAVKDHRRERYGQHAGGLCRKRPASARDQGRYLQARGHHPRQRPDEGLERGGLAEPSLERGVGIECVRQLHLGRCGSSVRQP